MSSHRCSLQAFHATLRSQRWQTSATSCAPSTLKIRAGSKAYIPHRRDPLGRCLTSIAQHQRIFLSPTGSSSTSVTPIEVLRDLPAVDLARQQWTPNTGFVPTMGALHSGHLSLMRRAAMQNDNVVVSIFVNPTQFGQNEDLGSYPRTWDQDIQLLHKLNYDLANDGIRGRVSSVFAPTVPVMYPGLPPTSDPQGHGSFVTITPLGSILEGASRPVFFRGVATVCMKLFNIVRPAQVFFGQKDAQQCCVIKRMVKDFHLPLEVIVVPTEREADGLAMSSRNVNLGARRRNAATMLYKALQVAEHAYLHQNVLDRSVLVAMAISAVRSRQAVEETKNPGERALSSLDYINVNDTEDMAVHERIDPARGAILSGALRMLPLEDIQTGEYVGENGNGKGVVRLIDNIVLPPKRCS